MTSIDNAAFAAAGIRAARPPMLAAPRWTRGVLWTGVAASAAWALLGFVTTAVPNKVAGFADWAYTEEFGWFGWAVAAVLLATSAIPGGPPALRRRVDAAGPWLVAIGLGLTLWQWLTAKTGALPAPFFAPPQSLAEVYVTDWAKLAEGALHSLRLLFIGIALGGITGFLVGVLIGWSKVANYWIHPVMRVVGPLPSTALLPICFYFFPSSFATAIFLIALSTAFPVAVLTWSGVAGVHRSYYDVARTMGASSWFLVLRVAIPASLPQVFVGLFMGLGAAFATLVVAEMLGVKAGLGFYLTWAQGWAAYPNMYAALIVMALVFSGVISLLFLVRDRVLSWQKGTVKW